MSSSSSSSSEIKPDETTSANTNTRTREGGTADDKNNRNKTGDVAAGAATSNKKARRVVVQQAQGPAATSTAAAEAALSKEREGEILEILAKLSSDDKEALYDGLDTMTGFYYSEGVVGPVANASTEFIVENDGVGLITMVIMKQKPTDVDILEAGSILLANLMWSFPDERIKVHRLGGAETVIKAMKENPDHRALQRAGCCFFRSFTLENKDRMQLVVDLDGIPSIVKAMNKHLNDKWLQADAIKGLHNFCAEEEYLGLIFEAGGFSAIAIALENHSFDPNTKDLAKEAMNVMLNDYL